LFVLFILKTEPLSSFLSVTVGREIRRAGPYSSALFSLAILDMFSSFLYNGDSILKFNNQGLGGGVDSQAEEFIPIKPGFFI
jgi:hypothetical protein